ncbi:MAG: hypothetical protein C0433_16640 [Cyclobacterium sp.]|nr:hypothetical protein [Cyclobacterium sp.]
MKITFVIGAAGSGKTSFIRNKYSKSEKMAVFDLAGTSWELFQDYQALEDGRSVDVYNECSQVGFFAMMDGKDLVVEYCADGYDDELFAVIDHAKKAGIRTEVICLTVDVDVAWERVQKADSTYFSSSQIKEDTLEVLSGMIEDYVFNQDFEKICEVGSDGGSVSFFRCKKQGREVFFFSTDESALFEFAPDFEFEKMPGVAYVEEFTNFRDAFEALLEKYPIFRLYPLEVSPKYKREFKEAYNNFLGLNKDEIRDERWNQFLN